MTLILLEETEKNLISKCKDLIAKNKAALLEVASLMDTLYLTTQVVVSNFLLMKHCSINKSLNSKLISLTSLNLKLSTEVTMVAHQLRNSKWDINFELNYQNHCAK